MTFFLVTTGISAGTWPATWLLARNLQAQETPPSISAKLLQEQSNVYENTVRRMRVDFSGNTPKKFVVDGVEFTGNYYRSGQNTDIYKIFRDGKITLLRIPRSKHTFQNCKNFVQAIRDAQSHGIQTVKILNEATPGGLATEVEFLDRFQTFREILKSASQNPNAPGIREKLDAIKEFAVEHGQKRMPDIKSENIGVEFKDGKYQVKVIDALDASAENGDYSKVPRSRSSLQKIFEEVKQESLSRNTRKNVMNPTGTATRPQSYQTLSAIENEIMASAYSPQNKPPAPPPLAIARQSAEITSRPRSAAVCESGLGAEASEVRLGVSKTLANAGVLFSLGSVIAAALTEHRGSDAIGVPCERANQLQGNLKCRWDSKLNPFNNIAYCTRITSVTPLEEKAFFFSYLDRVPLCEVVYDSVGVRIDSSEGRDRLKELGFFDRDGSQVQGKTAADLLKYLESQADVSESLIYDDIHFPGTPFPDFI